MPKNKDLLLQMLSGGVEKGLGIGASGAQKQMENESSAQKLQSEQQFQGAEKQKDRDNALELKRMSLDALLGKQAKPTDAEKRRQALINEQGVRSENLKQQYDSTPQWKQVVSRVPFVGDLAGQFDDEIRDMQANETAIAQNETFIKSGAQAPETEFKRMKTATLPGVFASADKKKQVLEQALSARDGIVLKDPNEMTDEELLKEAMEQ